MANSEERGRKQRRRPRIVYADEVQVERVYANNTQMTVTNWDVTLTFGMIEDSNADRLLVNRVARIVMSLQHAKAITRLLAQNIADFEKAYGEIKVIGDSSAPADDTANDEAERPE